MDSGGKGGSLEAGEARKGRKRRLVLESSDSEGDGYYISPRKKAATAAECNAGGGQGGGDQPREKAVAVGSERLFGPKSVEGNGSEKKGDEKRRPRSESDAKKIKIAEASDGCSGKGGSVSIDGIGGKTFRPGFPKWRLEREEVRAGWVIDDNGGVESRGSGGSKWKRRQLNLGGENEPDDDKRRQVEQLVSEKQRPLKTDRASSVGRDRQTVIRVQGKRGVLKLLPKNDKVAGEADHRDEEKHSAIAGSRGREANGEKKVVEKPISSIELRKSDPSVEGVSVEQKTKRHNLKVKIKPSKDQRQSAICPKDEYVGSSAHNTDKKRLLEHKVSPENLRLLEHKASLENLSKRTESKIIDLPGTSGCGLKKRDMKKPRAGVLSKVKQEVRDQIKRMLLDNGWKIDLRPRKGKDYEDSVYVSPQGTGYWSITKAYAVFQDHLKSLDNKHSTPSYKRGSHDPGGAGISSCIIPKDDLAMLKRNVVNKRRTKEKLNGKKYRGNRSRKANEDFPSRRSRNKNLDDEDAAKIKHRGCALLVRGSTHDMEENMDDYDPYEWKRTIFSWMMDLGLVSEDAKVKYMNKKGTRTRLEGRITREGIHCGCCSKILTVSKFELHAGSKEQQPYENIILEDGGVSLLQCLLDAWEKHAKSDKKGLYEIDAGDDPDDDTCGICGDGGDLICCDSCHSTFHLGCLGIQMPSGDWYCRNCYCRFCGSAQERTSSFAELLSCLQCNRKYHQACAPGTGKDSISVDASTSINCFCSPGCRKIYKRLQKLLCVKNDMEAGFSWSLVRCFADGRCAPPKRQALVAQCNSKTAVAFSVMDECFLPIIDERSGINVIHNVVYNCGSNFNRLDFRTFYTFILERGDEVISAASVRIHGTELAEMPFIGTRYMYRRQGMCRRLLNGIESVLCSLNIRRLIIPAISELKNTWTTVFGFKPVGPIQKQITQSVNLLIFHGTGLLQKRLFPADSANRQTTAAPANTARCDKMDTQTFGEASVSLMPVQVSHDFVASGNIETKDRENCCTAIGGSTGLTSNLPPRNDEVKTEGDINLHSLPAAGCQDNMQVKAEVDNTQERDDTETTASRLIVDNSVTEEQKSEDKSNRSHADLSVVSLAMDSCAFVSNEHMEDENCPSIKCSVETVVVGDKIECSLNFSSQDSDCLANNEESESCVVPADDATVSLVNKDQKPETIQDTDECGYKSGVFSPDQKLSSPVEDMQEKSNETYSAATLERIIVCALDISNGLSGEVVAKPSQTCGEDQLRGEGGKYSNGPEDDMASGKPVNA